MLLMQCLVGRAGSHPWAQADGSGDIGCNPELKTPGWEATVHREQAPVGLMLPSPSFVGHVFRSRRLVWLTLLEAFRSDTAAEAGLQTVSALQISFPLPPSLHKQLCPEVASPTSENSLPPPSPYLAGKQNTMPLKMTLPPVSFFS